MQLNTEELYTDMINLRDDIEKTLPLLKKGSTEYVSMSLVLIKLKESLAKCTKDLKERK